MDRRIWVRALLFCLAACALSAAGGSARAAGGGIVPIVGNGKDGPSGDGGPALKASFVTLADVAVDGRGNLYIPDMLASYVRKVGTDGIVRPFAGGRVPAGPGRGDGGPALRADVANPTRVAVDRQGNVYIAEQSDRLRKVDRNGIISTVVGLAPSTGPLGDGGPAAKAAVSNIGALAVDSAGNVYFAEHSHGARVRKISTNGIITTVAGSGSLGSSAGADSGDGGPATKAIFSGVIALAVDAHGNLYIGGNGRVHKVSPNGVMTAFAGTGVRGRSGDGGPATKAKINGAYRMALDKAGNLYFADSPVLRKVDTSGKISTITVPRGTDPRHPAVEGLAIDGKGNLYYTASRRVWKVPASYLASLSKKSSPAAKKPSSGSLAAVASRLEIALGRLASGRATLRATLRAVARCSISPPTAAAQVGSVIANRQSELSRLSALPASTAQARQIVTLFRQALKASITADRYYQAWLNHLPASATCPLPHDQTYRAAQHADTLASAAKARFLAAFNPIAKRLHLRTWTAGGF